MPPAFPCWWRLDHTDTPQADPTEGTGRFRHHPDATLNDNAPEAYRGPDRFVARKKVVADLDAAGLLVERLVRMGLRPGDEALFALDNVVLSPHQASASNETRRAMAELAVANLEAFFAGKPLVKPVPE